MKNRGFTLLELLGVIVILALLTTLVFPSVLNVIKKSSNRTDKISMDLINNAADIYIENHANSFKKRNGSKFIIDMKELIEDGNLPSNLKISDIEDIEEKCVQVTYINNKYSYELKDKGTCEMFLALPDEYQQVEYIKSTGTQYIDTNVVGNEKIKIKLTTRIIGDIKNSNIFGARPSVTGSTNAILVVSFSSTSELGFFYNGVSISAIPYDNEIHIYEFGNGIFKIDEKLYGNEEVSSFSTTLPLIIFGEINLSSNESVNVTSQAVYSCQVAENNILVRNFIPCYRKSDGVIGMYDLVEDKFYTNSGTGTFEKGKDI